MSRTASPCQMYAGLRKLIPSLPENHVTKLVLTLEVGSVPVITITTLQFDTEDTSEITETFQLTPTPEAT